MKFASLLAVTLALIALIGALLRLPDREVPRTLFAYLLVQFAYTLTCLWGMRAGAVATREYLHFYVLCLVASVALMLAVTWKLGAIHPAPIEFVTWLGGVVFAAAALCVTRHYLLEKFPDGLPNAALVVLAQGFILSVCGLVTLSSLAAVNSPASSILRAGLGSFWTLLGGLSFVFALGRVRQEKLWAELNLWLPATVGFVVFALMAFFVASQGELAREGTLELRCAEQTVEICERRSQ